MSQSAKFHFRPWVRRAGGSVLLVAAALSLGVGLAMVLPGGGRYGWAGEPAVLLYLAVIWVAGVKVFYGTFRPVAELGETAMVLRPLHLARARRVEWAKITGTEQMVRGDRLIIHYQTRRGLRFVAFNLNLVKGRREFLRALDERLFDLGFQEGIAGESRFLSRGPLENRAVGKG